MHLVVVPTVGVGVDVIWIVTGPPDGSFLGKAIGAGRTPGSVVVGSLRLVVTIAVVASLLMRFAASHDDGVKSWFLKTTLGGDESPRES